MNRIYRLLFFFSCVIPALTDDGKVSLGVTRLANEGRLVPVILLGKTQLLNGPATFQNYCSKHNDQKRAQLRAKVISRLKKIAANEQTAMRQALDLPDSAKSLWVVNGIAVLLKSSQIQEVSKSKLVKYVYPATSIPMAGGRGNVAEVLKNGAREPFSIKDKRVPWNLRKIKCDQVWDELKATGQDVVVAMLDSGVNYRHADLRNNIWCNKDEDPNNRKDDDENGLVDDYYGYNFSRMTPEIMARGPRQHGSWTAGIVAGDGTGGTVTGAAPRAQIMPLIAHGLYSTIRAHEYALEQGADIINMSFSIPDLGHTRGLWRLMAEHSTCAGLVQVSGAGNFQNLPRPVQLRIPEGMPCVIAVGGLTRNLELPSFVSLGPVEWESVKFYGDHPMPMGLTKPDVCGFAGAGYPLLSTNDKGYIDPNTRIRGNSFSGPHAAGVAALESGVRQQKIDALQAKLLDLEARKM